MLGVEVLMLMTVFELAEFPAALGFSLKDSLFTWFIQFRDFPPSDVNCSFPDSSAGKESTCSAGDPSSIPGSGRSAGEVDRLPTPVFLGFPCGSAGKESTCNE